MKKTVEFEYNHFEPGTSVVILGGKTVYVVDKMYPPTNLTDVATCSFKGQEDLCATSILREAIFVGMHMIGTITDRKYVVEQVNTDNSIRLKGHRTNCALEYFKERPIEFTLCGGKITTPEVFDKKLALQYLKEVLCFTE